MLALCAQPRACEVTQPRTSSSGPTYRPSQHVHLPNSSSSPSPTPCQGPRTMLEHWSSSTLPTPQASCGWPGSGLRAYLQGFLVLVHEEGYDGCAAATDPLGGKDQNDRAHLEVNGCKRVGKGRARWLHRVLGPGDMKEWANNCASLSCLQGALTP